MEVVEEPVLSGAEGQATSLEDGFEAHLRPLVPYLKIVYYRYRLQLINP
jgi:hypothetical protein